MKLFPLLCILFNLIPLTVTGLELETHFGFCASEGSGQAILIASGGEMPYTYQWSDPNLVGDEVYDLIPGTYSVTVNDANGCAVVETFEILSQSSVFLDYVVFDITCPGFNDGKIFIDAFTPSDLKFSTDGVNFSDQTIFENLELGNFNLYVLESNGCITEEVFNIVEPFEVFVDGGDDFQILLGEEVTISPIINSPSNDVLFEWSSTDPDFAPCTGCVEITVTPFETTTYTVTVTTVPGCFTTDEVTVFVSKPDDVFIPNVFSPNGDGFNDLFTIYTGSSVQAIKKFTIRDNFGSIVFEALDFIGNNFISGWDGSFRGKRVNPGAFIYHVQVEYLDGEIKDFFGTVTLAK